MYPSRPITKIDEFSRAIVFYRLCKFLQDNLAGLPLITRISYCVLIECLATKATNFISYEVPDCLRKLTMSDPVSMAMDNSSTMSLIAHDLEGMNLEDPANASPSLLPQPDISWLADAFFGSDTLPALPEKRFHPSMPLFLLWAESLTAFSFQFPTLARLVRRQLLRRAKYEVVPLAILALS